MKIWSDCMNRDGLALRLDDSPKMDGCTALRGVRVHCQCASWFPLARVLAPEQLQSASLKSVLPSCRGKSWIVYAL